jgi:lysophospholipase L1-like esterase
LRQLLLSVTAVLVFFGALELLLRGAVALGLLELPALQTVREVWADQGFLVDRDLSWTLFPNWSGMDVGVEVRTNSHGLRDQEVPFQKPSDTVRILALGDSTVYGHGVPFERSFSERLEQMLNAGSGPTRFEVVNAGVPGYSIYNAFVYLKRNGIRFDPDVIILETNVNDRRYVPGQQYEDSAAFYLRFYYLLRLREVLSRSLLYRGMRRALAASVGLSGGSLIEKGEFEYETVDLDDLHCRVDPDRYREILGELVRFAQARDIPVILVPLNDAPLYVQNLEQAKALELEGDYQGALSKLRPLARQGGMYKIIARRRINELRERMGMPGKRRAQVRLPNEAMGMGGNVFVHLSQPYAEIMEDVAAREERVVSASLEPQSAWKGDVYWDYIHLNSYGHRMLARQLFSALRDSEELDFAPLRHRGRLSPNL